MAKSFFTVGDIVSPEYLNAINRPVFDGKDEDGHFQPIKNADLDKSIGSIYYDFYAYINELKVTNPQGACDPFTALLVVNAGIIVNSKKQRFYVAKTNVAVSNNSTNYVWVNELGLVASGSSLPDKDPVVPLAKVIMAGGVVGEIEDLRSRSMQYVVVPTVVKSSSIVNLQENLLQSYVSTTGENYALYTKIRKLVTDKANFGLMTTFANWLAVLSDETSKIGDLAQATNELFELIKNDLTVEEALVLQSLITG